MAGSKGYNSRAYVSNAPGAFYLIAASDFGASVPTVATLASQATGSIQTTTADVFIKTSWITAEGESVAGAEATIALSSATAYGVIVTQPTVPTNGQTILGWRIYSSYATGTEKLNAANDTTNFTTSQGVIAGIAISSNSAATQTILVIGATTSPQTVDNSGIQTALPSVPANSTVDYYAVVPNSGSQWKVQKSVNFMRSDGTTETAGIVLSHLDCISPEYPGTAQVVTAGPTSYFVMNGYLFEATTGGTTATTFIGASAFNTTKGKTTADGSVVWTSLGKAALIRFLFGNVSVSAATPVAQAYELFEE